MMLAIFVFVELGVILRPFVLGPSRENEIKMAKEMVLDTYCRRNSGSINFSNHKDCDHVQKIKRVYQTLCEFIRHPDQILASLFQTRAVTTQEHESIRSQLTLHQWASHLLDVLSATLASAYMCFLAALDATNQHHLYRLLEEKGKFPQYFKRRRQFCHI